MNPIWLALLVVAPFAVAAWLAAWSRKDTWGRPAAIVLFIVALPTIAAAGIEALGVHRPLWTVWDLAPGDHRVLAVKMVQDEAIFLYLDDPARMAPRPIVLPWSNEAASRIQGLIDEAGDEAKGQFLLRYDPSLDESEQQFHPLPHPPALPPKPVPAPVPHFNMEGS